METSLHRQLKAFYCESEADCEVTLDGCRIDVVRDNCLIEIQYGSLASIRQKVSRLLKRHRVLVVKPLSARKYIVTRKRRGGPVTSARYSPKHESLLDLFVDLVYFVDVFPHPRLTLEVLLTEQEEHRLPALRQRRWSRKRFRVEDRLLRGICSRHQLRTAQDLADMLPNAIPETFSTKDISQGGEIPRRLAQKMAYCLRKCGATDTVGKAGNAWMYQLAPRKRRRAA